MATHLHVTKKAGYQLDYFKTEISSIKSEIYNLESKSSKTVSKQELELLRVRIDRLERKVNKYLAQ